MIDDMIYFMTFMTGLFGVAALFVTGPWMLTAAWCGLLGCEVDIEQAKTLVSMGLSLLTFSALGALWIFAQIKLRKRREADPLDTDSHVR